jgi:hypothetical protein
MGSDTSESKYTRYKVAMNVCLPERFFTLARTEISQFDFSISWNQYVLRLYITMKNAFFMNIDSGFKYIMTDWSYFIQIKKCFLIFVEFIQIAIHKLKDQSHFFYLKCKIPSEESYRTSISLIICGWLRDLRALIYLSFLILSILAYLCFIIFRAYLWLSILEVAINTYEYVPYPFFVYNL